MKKQAALLVCIVLGISGGFYFGTSAPRVAKRPVKAELKPRVLAESPHVPESSAEIELAQIGDPAKSPQQRVRRTYGLLKDFTMAMRRSAGRPLATNQEYTAAFLGGNPLGIVFLDTRNPAISAQGELLDPWQKPYFFHALAKDSFEVISGGPDGRLFSNDDIVFPRNGSTSSRN